MLYIYTWFRLCGVLAHMQNTEVGVQVDAFRDVTHAWTGCRAGG